MRNVSRAWAYETGLAAGVELGPDIPVNEYYEYFGPDYQLDVKSSNTDDLNTPAYLNRVKQIVMENLRHCGGVPSVQMTDTPTLPIDAEMDDLNADEDLIPPDTRRPRRLLDSRIQNDGELSDSDDEGEGGRRNHARHRYSHSVESNGGIAGRKYGAGIMHTSSAPTHGAGPSGLVTRLFSTPEGQGNGSSMEVETPPPEGVEGVEAEVKMENGSEGEGGGSGEISEAMDIDSSSAPTPTTTVNVTEGQTAPTAPVATTVVPTTNPT